MTELFIAVGIFVSVMSVFCVSFGLLYAFGGKEIREQLRSEW